MYIQEVVAAVNVLTNCVYIILKFLLASIFCHCDYLCNTTNFLHEIPYFMKPSPFCVILSTSFLWMLQKPRPV